MPRILAAFVWLWLALGCRVALADLPQLTNTLQLSKLALDLSVAYQIRLEGDVLWVDSSGGEIVLRDESGLARLQVDLRDHGVSVGQRVRIFGDASVARDGGDYRLGVCGALVDNDGIHSLQERSGSAYLTGGLHPIRLDWFNDSGDSGLKVEYSGPDIVRQRIPNSALLRTPADGAATNRWQLVPGLKYECFAVPVNFLLRSGARTLLKTGCVDNFDVSVAGGSNYTCMNFAGFLDVRREGVYTFHLISDDGSRLFIDTPPLQCEVLGRAGFPSPRQLMAGQPVEEECLWAAVSGTVAFVSQPANEMELELRSGSGRMRVRITNPEGLRPGALLGKRVRVVGVCLRACSPDGQQSAGRLLVSDARQVELLEPSRSSPATNSLPVLETAAQVHRLSREEALRQYPVSIRGVVTCAEPEHQAVVIQDATRGIYVFDLSPQRSRLPEIGSFVEVTGLTDPSFFAPVVRSLEVTELGAGVMPDPVHPTWDQIMSGSLDAQFVEFRGIITAVNPAGVTLLMREGRVNVELRVAGMGNSELSRYLNALVRLRGTLFANWNYLTHEVKAGEVRLYNAAISVDEPAVPDIFSVREKTFGELMLFDPQAGEFEQVKVSGQVLNVHGTECYLTDGKIGLRVVGNQPLGVSVGDRAEIVGFSELRGDTPTLREAVARRIGHAPLPSALPIPKDDLLAGKYDAKWVRVACTLVSLRRTSTEQLLEVRSGLRTFVARLPGGPNLDEMLQAGSVLELTGVYSGLGGDKAMGQEITSFELLLNSFSDIKVLARPPWWTLERLLVTVGALVCVLVAALVWITQLHKQVEERTRQLEKQIRERERAEQQRALEQERSRVAQDLHDDLGAGLTEISVLGNQVRARAASEQQRAQYLDQIDERAGRMVNALDEIVWAMSPAQDSLESLVSYFCLHADRFLGAANIAWRLDGGQSLPDTPVNSICRHELFMAFKEVLTNVVRHSKATEVKVGFHLEQGSLILTVADNGQGIASEKRSRHSDGLTNMRARMEKLKGGFEIASEPGHGTTLRFRVPTEN